jgi:hypothetical protein
MAVIEFDGALSRGIYDVSPRHGWKAGPVGFREESHLEAGLRASANLEAVKQANAQTRVASKEALFDAVFVGEYNKDRKITGYRLPVLPLVGVVEYRLGLDTLLRTMENSDLHSASRIAGNDRDSLYGIQKKQASDRMFINTVLQGGLVSSVSDIERFYELRNSESYQTAAAEAYQRVLKECKMSDYAYEGQNKEEQRRRGLLQVGAREIPIYQVRRAPRFVARALGRG